MCFHVALCLQAAGALNDHVCADKPYKMNTNPWRLTWVDSSQKLSGFLFFITAAAGVEKQQEKD